LTFVNAGRLRSAQGVGPGATSSRRLRHRRHSVSGASPAAVETSCGLLLDLPGHDA
jgi:hypothetical protein